MVRQALSLNGGLLNSEHSCLMEYPVTVVVPVFNRAALIGRCLDSIHSQTYRPLRVIVVDNGSTDTTRDTVMEWIRSHSADAAFETLLETENRRGATAARQRGLDLSESPVTLFFDSDDAMRPDLVATAMDSLYSPESPDIVCWRLMHHRADGDRMSRRISPHPDMYDQLVYSFLPTQGYAMRTELCRRAGGWSRSHPVWNDWELGVRLMLTSPRIAVTDRCLVDYYPQDDSITGTSFSAKAGKWEAVLDSVEKTLEASGDPRRRGWIRTVNYRRVILAAIYSREGDTRSASVLLRKALAHRSLGFWRRMVMRGVYLYTKAGGRGAYRLAGPLL